MGGKPRVKSTHVLCVLDRSGSMASLAEDAIGGFNQFVEEQKKDAENTTLTVVLFDHEYQTFYKGDMAGAPALDKRTYVPRGMTALLDAIGQGIQELETQTKKKDNVIVMVFTDGLENASKEWGRQRIQELIESKRENNWEFVFLAADENAINVAYSYGINNAVTTQNSSRGMSASFATMDYATKSFKSGQQLRSAGLQSNYDLSVTGPDNATDGATWTDDLTNKDFGGIVDDDDNKDPLNI